MWDKDTVEPFPESRMEDGACCTTGTAQRSQCLVPFLKPMRGQLDKPATCFIVDTFGQSAQLGDDFVIELGGQGCDLGDPKGESVLVQPGWKR